MASERHDELRARAEDVQRQYDSGGPLQAPPAHLVAAWPHEVLALLGEVAAAEARAERAEAALRRAQTGLRAAIEGLDLAAKVHEAIDMDDAEDEAIKKRAVGTMLLALAAARDFLAESDAALAEAGRVPPPQDLEAQPTKERSACAEVDSLFAWLDTQLAVSVTEAQAIEIATDLALSRSLKRNLEVALGEVRRVAASSAVSAEDATKAAPSEPEVRTSARGSASGSLGAEGSPPQEGTAP